MYELTIEQITRIYNTGYNIGHNDTVEGCDIPVHNSDMDEFNVEIVEEILEDLTND